MKPPASLYRPSTRVMPASLPEPRYPGYDDVLRVGAGGSIYISGVGLVYVTTALTGMYVGIDEQPDGRWLVSFMKLDLGLFDRSTNRLMPIPPP